MCFWSHKNKSSLTRFCGATLFVKRYASGELQLCLCLLLSEPPQYPAESCSRYLEVLVILPRCMLVPHLADVTGPGRLLLPRRCQQHHGERRGVGRLDDKLEVQLTEHLTAGFS